MKIKTLFIAIMLFCAIGNLNAQESQSQPITLSALFEYPTVPEDIEDWTERNNWLIENFWNNFNFKQKSVGQIQLNHAFKTWTVPMRFASKDIVMKTTDKLLSKLSKNPTMLYQFTKSAEETLYSPKSEIWIDEVYVKFIEAITKNKKIDEIRKVRYKDQLNKLNNSLVGNTMPDFSYIDRNGETTEFKPTAGFSIIEFGHPDCTDCKISKIHLESDVVIGRFINEGKIDMFYIIPDMDNEDWQNMVADYPVNWKVGASEDAEDIFDIRLSPTFYIIDSEKKIILKNAPVEEVIQTIKNLVE